MDSNSNLNITSLLLTEVIKVENEDERELLEQFKERTKDLQEEEESLLRFLRAREYNLDKAEDMLRKSIKWKKENGNSTILEYNVPEKIKQGLFFDLSGRDCAGAPIIFAPIGSWTGRQLVEEGLRDECLKYGHQLMESAYVIFKEVGYKPAYLLIDLEGLSMYQVTHLETMRTIFAGLQMMEMNYPEALKRVTIVNAPWLFTMAFNFLKPILSAHTIAKIQVFGNSKKQWLPELQKNIPDTYIPDSLFQD